MSNKKEISTKVNDLDALMAISVVSADEQALFDASKSDSKFLQGIRLYWKSKSNQNGTIIEGGQFGVSRTKDDILSLGKSIDLVPIARRAKAIDWSNPTEMVVVTDVNNAEFKRIINEVDNTDTETCAYGPSYLVYERSQQSFFEYFCGNRSGKIMANDLNLYLPVSQAMIDAGQTNETSPRFALTCTLSGKFYSKGGREGFVPNVSSCNVPIDLPSVEVLKVAIENFRKLEVPNFETAVAGGNSSRVR